MHFYGPIRHRKGLCQLLPTMSLRLVMSAVMIATGQVAKARDDVSIFRHFNTLPALYSHHVVEI